MSVMEPLPPLHEKRHFHSELGDRNHLQPEFNAPRRRDLSGKDGRMTRAISVKAGLVIV